MKMENTIQYIETKLLQAQMFPKSTNVFCKYDSINISLIIIITDVNKTNLLGE